MKWGLTLGVSRKVVCDFFFKCEVVGRYEFVHTQSYDLLNYK